MTRFIHDQFAKDYLEELLSPYGQVQAPRRVSGEARQVDVWFSPNSQAAADLSAIGLLGRLAATPSVFEPFRNAATVDEVCDCLLKLLELRAGLRREANRNNTNIQESELPKLWILTPTASTALLAGFRATLDEENGIAGVYYMAENLRTAVVVIHQLPRTPETLWLRILGRGNVQKQAIDELEALPEDNPFRANALKLLYSLIKELEVDRDSEEEDRELVMRLSPLYVQDREQAIQEGMQQGMQQGMRLVVENLLRVRFGEIDEQLATIIQPILALPSEEFTPLLLQLSREELLSRFGQQNLGTSSGEQN